MNQELIDYIKQQINLNVPKSKINEILLGQGWNQAELDQAFNAATGLAKPAALPSSAPADKPAAPGNNSANEFDDIEKSQSAGPNRKTALIIVSGFFLLVILAVIASIIIFSKKNDNPAENSADNAPVAKTESQIAAEKAATEKLAAEEKAQKEFQDQIRASVQALEGLIQPPAGWIAKQGTMATRPAIVYSKPIPEKNAKGEEIFTEYINILKAENTGTQDEYLAKTKTAFKTEIPDYKIISERKIKLSGGDDAVMMGGAYTKDGVALRNIQILVFKGSDVYIVTGVVTAANWNSEKEAVGTSITSFKLK